MSDRIYAALTEDFVRRMRNWAKSGAGLLVSGGTISSIYEHGVRVDRYVGSEPPLLSGEADDTEIALRAVAPKYRQAVQQFWLFEGRSLREHGRRRRIDYHTFEVWVIEGHELLKAELARLAEIWRSHGAALREEVARA